MANLVERPPVQWPARIRIRHGDGVVVTARVESWDHVRDLVECEQRKGDVVVTLRWTSSMSVERQR
jgi:hypothetical protein